MNNALAQEYKDTPRRKNKSEKEKEHRIYHSANKQ